VLLANEVLRYWEVLHQALLEAHFLRNQIKLW